MICCKRHSERIQLSYAIYFANKVVANAVTELNGNCKEDRKKRKKRKKKHVKLNCLCLFYLKQKLSNFVFIFVCRTIGNNPTCTYFILDYAVYRSSSKNIVQQLRHVHSVIKCQFILPVWLHFFSRTIDPLLHSLIQSRRLMKTTTQSDFRDLEPNWILFFYVE